MKTYRIKTIEDLLSIPTDRRAAFLREVEYSLQLLEFAVGSGEAELASITWTDDGDPSCSIEANGEVLLRMEVQQQ